MLLAAAGFAEQDWSIASIILLFVTMYWFLLTSILVGYLTFLVLRTVVEVALFGQRVSLRQLFVFTLGVAIATVMVLALHRQFY